MPQADGSALRCQICDKACGSREDALLHLQKHVLYKKYPCEDCTQSFYSDAQREEHCSSEKHHHAFKVNIDQYKEMLVNMIYKDMENLKSHDVDVVVATRAKYNAEYNSAMQTTKVMPKQRPSASKNASVPTESTPASRKRRSSARAATPKPETPPASAAPATAPLVKKTLTKTPEAPKSEERRKRTPSMTNIILANPELIPGTLSEAINLSLTTTEANAKCVLCHAKVPVEYVFRKDHVSKCHMPAAHDDDDYVQILEQRMTEAFPCLTYSDIQCQFDSCGLKFQSDSGRRKHALLHVPIQLKCPICDIHDVEAKKVNKHLRDVHHLDEGWRSIKDRFIRSEFEQKFMEQTQTVMKVYAKSFPVCIPSVYLNPRSTTKPQNPNTFASVLGEMVREPRAFQQIPNVPPRRLSESTDSEDERERQIRKRKQDRSECEQKEYKKHRNAQRSSVSSSSVADYSAAENQNGVSSDDDDAVTQFAEVKEELPNNQEIPSSTSTKPRDIESASTTTKKRDAVESDQGTATSSESEITFLGEKKSKKRRKMISEEEVKKEPEDEKFDTGSTNTSAQSSSTLDGQGTMDTARVAEQKGLEPGNEPNNELHEKRKAGVRKTRWDAGPVAPVQDSPPTPNRKKGTELNMTLERQRPSYSLLSFKK